MAWGCVLHREMAEACLKAQRTNPDRGIWSLEVRPQGRVEVGLQEMEEMEWICGHL